MNPNIRKIVGFSVGFAVILQLVPIFNFTPHNWIIQTINYSHLLTPNIGLTYLIPRLFSYTNYDTGLSINFLDLGIYVLLLSGMFFYFKTKGKEVGLLRLTLGVVLLSKAIALLYMVFFPIVKGNLSTAGFKGVLIWLFYFLTHVAWGYMAFIFLRFLSKGRELQTKVHTGDVDSLPEPVDAPKSQRLANHIIDLLLSIMICSRAIVLALMPVLEYIEQNMGERQAMLLVAILSRLVYYLFFETLFQATPAKFLTSTKVLFLKEGQQKFKTTFVRTLSRHIPFEAFSYLGEGNGWHDKLADTRVVKEKNEGIPVKKFLWIIPVFALIGGLSYLGYELKDNYDSYTYQKNKHENMIERFSTSIQQLSPHYFLKIDAVEANYSDDYEHYLKVKSIDGDKVTFEVFKMEEYNPTSYEIEKYFEQIGWDLPLITVTKAQLLQSFTPDYKEFKNRDRQGTVFFTTVDKKFYIEEIYKAYQPAIVLNGGSGCGDNYIYMGLINEGWKAQIVSIENLEGELDWQLELPIDIKSKEGYRSNGISLRAENFKRNKVYKFSFTVQDSLGNQQKYLVEGINLDKEIKQLPNE